MGTNLIANKSVKEYRYSATDGVECIFATIDGYDRFDRNCMT